MARCFPQLVRGEVKTKTHRESLCPSRKGCAGKEAEKSELHTQEFFMCVSFYFAACTPDKNRPRKLVQRSAICCFSSPPVVCEEKKTFLLWNENITLKRCATLHGAAAMLLLAFTFFFYLLHYKLNLSWNFCSYFLKRGAKVELKRIMFTSDNFSSNEMSALLKRSGSNLSFQEF